MSRDDDLYKRFGLGRLDLGAIRTHPLRPSGRRVRIADFVPESALNERSHVADLLPNILKGKDLKEIAARVGAAVRSSKPVITALGAHVVKCGLSPLIIDLIRRGIVSAVACTGALVIHDLEIALVGATSEDVAKDLGEGRFGMAAETATHLSDALSRYVTDDVGIGFAVGRYLLEEEFPHRGHSILAAAAEHDIPLTVHVAVGTDITHMHPSTDGALLGKGSHNDFRLFAAVVAQLGEGGCFFNIGSAVVLPEVFLKAVALARNLGHPTHGFTAVNMDMLQHYRPTENVVRRPVEPGGTGYALTGHHEILLPVLYQMILRELASPR